MQVSNVTPSLWLLITWMASLGFVVDLFYLGLIDVVGPVAQGTI